MRPNHQFRWKLARASKSNGTIRRVQRRDIRHPPQLRLERGRRSNRWYPEEIVHAADLAPAAALVEPGGRNIRDHRPAPLRKTTNLADLRVRKRIGLDQEQNPHLSPFETSRLDLPRRHILWRVSRIAEQAEQVGMCLVRVCCVA